MKIYHPQKDSIIRINFKKQGVKTEHLNLCECTKEEVYRIIVDTINSAGLSPIQKGRVTNVEIREAVGGTNGKSISVSFKGLEPKQMLDLIMNKLP